MNVIEWLMMGDPAVQRLTSKYLLESELPYTEEGIVKQYLSFFDIKTGLWGNGVYSPKWISTHYTLLELKYMEISPQNNYYQIGLRHLLDFNCKDICVLAMIVDLSVYGQSNDPRIFKMVDYILAHQMYDGGWNCSWDSVTRPSFKSSLHTTLTVIEAFNAYLMCGYSYQEEKIKSVILMGEAFILNKKLLRSVSTNQIINPAFLKFHYPQRWKYDAIRALEYFVSVKRPFDFRMKEALDLVIKEIEKGWVAKGTQYSGKKHFVLETTKAGRFNTFRALKILKFYAPILYNQVIQMEHELIH